MRSLMRSGGFDIVVDATHPYASAATETIAAASAAEGLEYVRLLRGGDERGEWLSARDAAEAAGAAAVRAVDLLLGGLSGCINPDMLRECASGIRARTR